MADHIDTLEDRVKERLAKMKAQNPTLDLDQLPNSRQRWWSRR
jgi:hypothetical protein